MDSKLLNAFHDDPFDGNYVKYDSDTQFWSNDSGTLGLQLAETLHGILPIAPSEVISNSLLNNSMLKEGDYSLESKNTKMFENYEDVSPMKLLNRTQFSYQDTIENVSSQTNSTYDSDFLQSVDYNCDVVEIGNDERTLGNVDFDELRSCSRSTFRSRTDSSSIGDYESHSSDYYNDDDDEEEEEDEIEDEFKNVLTELPSNLSTKQHFDCTFNPDGDDIKKSFDEVDPFTMQLDVSTFDLATFITQDDQILYNQTSSFTPNAPNQIKLPENADLIIPSDSDSDSDVIVDVETVETEEKDISSWSGEKTNKINNAKEIKPIEIKFPQKPNQASPSKCPNVFVKRKFGIGQGKNLNMHRNSLQATPKSPKSPKSEESNKLKQNNSNTSNNIRKSNVVEKKKNTSNVQSKIPAPDKNKTELIVKKQESKPAEASLKKTNHIELVDHKQTIVHNECRSFDKNETTKKKKESFGDKAKTLTEEVDVFSQTHEKLPKKRKLNLEEYKKRRENPSIHNSSVQTPVPVVTKPLPKSQVNKPQPTEAVASIVNSLKENQSSKPFVDPITEAKNKVLRLQELKKAQQIKIIESTVSSKVARVTKLLPLKDIVKGSYKTCDDDSYANNKSEYEEIIILSAGCNTDITIPPNGYNIVQQNPETNLSRSLLKSNVLLANISNSFQKVRSNENVKISHSSLIVSIQDTVVKKNSSLVIEPTQEKTSSTTAEHGEDKIIMHLRKDRIRKRTFCQSTQTEILPEFPPLTLRLQSSRRHSNSSATRRKKEHRKYRARQSSYSSDEETYNCRSQNNSSSKKFKSKRSRRHRSSISSSSYSESEDNFKRRHRDSDSSSHSRGCSISSNEPRSRSFDRIYNRNSRSRSKSIRSGSKRSEGSSYNEKNVSAPAVEERRIVYVGRIEPATTKEMLRKKFIGYGPIKQITIHYKDTGMKYGFITYDKSEDAFRVIDCGQKDDSINMYDISFGGRRAFCRQSYADLDNAGMNSYQSYVAPHQKGAPKEEESFETLLLKVKAKLKATKSSGSNVKT